MSELRDCMVPRLPNRTDKLKRSLGRFRFAVAANALAAHPRAWRNLRAHDRSFQGTGRTFPWHAMTRFQGGERACTGQQFENATPGNCYHLTAGARLLVLHEGVCLMTAHTRLAFHEWIRLSCGT